MLDLPGELGSTALSLAKEPGFDHIKPTIFRCLAGVEPSTGTDPALSHESVRNGMGGLPDLFGRLREIERLLM